MPSTLLPATSTFPVDPCSARSGAGRVLVFTAWVRSCATTIAETVPGSGGFGNLLHRTGHHAGQGSPSRGWPDPGAVRQRREPGALGAQRSRTGRGHAAMELSVASTSSHRDDRPVTTSCPSPPCTSATTSHCCSRRSRPRRFARPPTRSSARGQARTEWDIVDDLMRRMATVPGVRGLAAARLSAGCSAADSTPGSWSTRSSGSAVAATGSLRRGGLSPGASRKAGRTAGARTGVAHRRPPRRRGLPGQADTTAAQ